LPDAIFEEAFDRVLQKCVESGMVSGHTQAIDSAYIKANASLDSLEVKKPAHTLKEHISKLSDENDHDPDQSPQRKAKKDRSTPGATDTKEQPEGVKRSGYPSEMV
jgi:hypothetical protein